MTEYSPVYDPELEYQIDDIPLITPEQAQEYSRKRNKEDKVWEARKGNRIDEAIHEKTPGKYWARLMQK